MSLLDKGRQTVEVFPPIEIVDDWGNVTLRPGRPEIDTPIEVPNVLVQPATSDADMSQGYLLLDVYRIITRHWPYPAKTIVRYDGRLWDVKENPADRPYSRMTAHRTIIMRARGEEVPDG